MKRSKKVKGFTLIELLVVIAIIAILAAILIPAVTKGLLNAKMLKMINNGKQIYTSVFAASADDTGGTAVTFPRSAAGRLKFASTHDYFVALVTNKVMEVDFGFFSGPGTDVVKSPDPTQFRAQKGSDGCAWRVCEDIGGAPDGAPFLVSRNLKSNPIPKSSTSGTDLSAPAHLGETTGSIALDFNLDAAIIVQKGGAALKLKKNQLRNSNSVNATTLDIKTLDP